DLFPMNNAFAFGPDGRMFAVQDNRIFAIDVDARVATPCLGPFDAFLDTPAFDAAGNLYFTSTDFDTFTTQLVRVAAGPICGEPVTPLATIGAAVAIAFDEQERLYFTNNQDRVVQRYENGTITTIAGNGTAGTGGDGGPATAAAISRPWG